MAATGRELSNLESNSFKIYVYKIVPCAKKFGHDWSECPFAHEGEKATRRCPALYRYSSIVCPDTRQSKACPRGDVCPYSHSIFEYWMHPARFRAQLCSFGTDCNRRICFFAHTQEQLRIPSEPVVADAVASRAPYLQGRVAPETRYALYPDQVPQLVPVQGGRMLTAGGQHQHMQQQQQLLGQADLSGMQVVYMPAAPQAATLQAHGHAAALQGPAQQWAAAGAGGGNLVLVPAGQAAAGGGLQYYAVQPAGAAVAAGPASQEYSSGMLVAPGVQLLGGSYGGGQPLQLVQMPGDGGMQQYAAVHAGGMQGAQVAYAPVFAAPGGGVAMQQWGGQEQQPAPPPPPHALLPGMVMPVQQQQQQRRLSQHAAHHAPHSQQLQLVVPEGAGDAGVAAGSSRQQQEGTYILTPSGQLAPGRGQLEGGPYTVMAAGPAGMLQQAACSSMPGSSQGPVEQGGSAACPPGVDKIAQQMAGWGIQ
uniref:C3H1-type domain-containing protein n=1 Tax=Tetradesmus obliquus TaxID=3088 RepID=A0A383V792_TETOB|eukprot:jgi/Sobl393_1/9390/SZX61455.1